MPPLNARRTSAPAMTRPREIQQTLSRRAINWSGNEKFRTGLTMHVQNRTTPPSTASRVCWNKNLVRCRPGSANVSTEHLAKQARSRSDRWRLSPRDGRFGGLKPLRRTDTTRATCKALGPRKPYVEMATSRWVQRWRLDHHRSCSGWPRPRPHRFDQRASGRFHGCRGRFLSGARPCPRHERRIQRVQGDWSDRAARLGGSLWTCCARIRSTRRCYAMGCR